MSCDRRTFIARVGSAVCALSGVTMVGCRDERAERPEREEIVRVPTMSRPLLLPWSEDAVRISSPMDELPMAYVSMSHRRIYVDYDFRDRVYWALRAHISVSTGVWRIPLPGDPERVPITPGDQLREFEEFALRDWDPRIRPAEGDMRIRGGHRVRVQVDFDCLPVLGTGQSCSAGPLQIDRCQPPGEDACREDFVAIGSADRHEERSCERSAVTVQLMTWACR